MSRPKKNGHALGPNGAEATEASSLQSLVGSDGRQRANGNAGRVIGAAVQNGHDAPARSDPAPSADAGAPRKRRLYDCSKCPGYCCSYPVITVTKYDLERLARYFGISPEEAEARFTKSQHGYKRILRRKKDEHFGKICRFFDQENRRCGIYPARPHVCRSFPGDGRCGYWDFLSFERRTQNDPEFVSLTNHTQ